jgi:hypothetical protein
VTGDSSCVNLDALVPQYLAAIPYDSSEDTPNHSGYSVYLNVGRAEVIAVNLGLAQPTNTTPFSLVSSGLVGYWKFDEGSGISTANSQGANTATLLNGPTWVSGKFGNALSFNGTNQYATLASQISAPYNTNYTVMIWYKGTDTAQNGSWGKVLMGRNSNDIHQNLILRSGYAEFLHYDSAWRHDIISPSIIADNSWHHIAYVNYSNGTGDLYIDGTKVINGVPSAGNSLYPYRIDGFMIGYLSVYTSGAIDDARYYNRSLSATEIATIASGGG